MSEDATDEDWTGMGTGSDHGAPGEHLPEPPLSEDEQRLLDELRRPAEGESEPAVEDSAAAVESAEGDLPLPAEGGDEGDPDSARFQPPA